MTSLNHDVFDAELSRLLRRSQSDADRFLARSALMWLSVARRPLRADELHIALRVTESRDIERTQQLLTEPATCAEDHASTLSALLGGLVTLAKDPLDASKIYVSLSDPELRTYLSHLSEIFPDNDPVLSFSFSSPEAHMVVARACMDMCSVTALQLAYAHDDKRVSSLMLYSWSNWNTHLYLSGCSFGDDDTARLADSMIFGVLVDILVLLISLNDFITGPLAFPSTMSRIACVSDIRQVQMALEQPMLLLSALVSKEGYAATLQGARRIFEGSKYSSHTSASPQKGDVRKESGRGVHSSQRTTHSKVESLGIDKLLEDTLTLFGETERQMVHSFAEVARGLRSTCITLSAPALYDQLLRKHGGAWSPMDVLVNAANWMEAVASYPYWQDIPDRASSNSLVISDPNDVNYDAAQRVLRLAKLVSPSSRQANNEHPIRPPHVSNSSKRPAGISAVRWRSATSIDRAMNLLPVTPRQPTFTIEVPLVVAPRPSSFASFPPQMHARGDPRTVFSYVPDYLRRFYRERAPPHFSRVANSRIVLAMKKFGSGAFTTGLSHDWPALKSALLADGYRAAIVYVGVAILSNHVRRILLPWLGTYMFYNPMEDLRLVLTRPDVFLDEAFAFSWSWVVLSYSQRYICDVFGSLFMGILVLNSNGAVAGGSTVANPRSIPEPTMQVVKVGYILWLLSTLDYIFARSINTFSFMSAHWRLLSGGDAERIALGQVLKANWPKVLFVGAQVFDYAANGLWPLFYTSILCALVGRPGLLLLSVSVAAGAAATIRYRARLYIALELSGMFVVLGLAVAAAALLAAEFVADPLGFGAGIGAARRHGTRARASLPRGARYREDILAGGTAAPVWRGKVVS